MKSLMSVAVLLSLLSFGTYLLDPAPSNHSGARGAFTAEQAAANNPAAAAAAAASRFAADMMFRWQQHQQHQQHQHGGGAQWAPPPTPISFPRGTANAGTSNDAARRAYFRAEEALTLAREQLVRNEETLRRMGEEVQRARAWIGESKRTYFSGFFVNIVGVVVVDSLLLLYTSTAAAVPVQSVVRT